MPNRIIRDALLDSERYLELTHDSERLLYIELLLCMDDYGLVPVNYSVLRRKTSVCMSKTKEQVLKMLGALADVDLIRVYEHDGSRYAYVPRTRQRPQSIKPKWPMPPEALTGPDISEAQKHARNLGRSQASSQSNQALSAVEQCGNSVATGDQRPNTNTNTSTKTKEIPIVASQLVPQAGLAGHVDDDDSPHGAATRTRTPRTATPSAPARIVDCPHQALVDAYHRSCPTLARVEIVSPQRQAAMRSRWREVCADQGYTAEQGVEWFEQFFGAVGASRFLTGRVQPRHGQQVSWRASFDWLLKPANFIKVVEGTYRNKEH